MARTMKMPRKKRARKGKKGKSSKTTEKQVESVDLPQETVKEGESDAERPAVSEDKKVEEGVTDSAGSEGTGEKSIKKGLSLQLNKVTGTKRLKKRPKPVESVET